MDVRTDQPAALDERPGPDDLATLHRAVQLLNRHLDREDPPGLEHARRETGEREDAILAIPELTRPAGLSAAEIAPRVQYKVSNVYRLLAGLSDARLLERVPGRTPARWRLARHRREGIATFVAMAATVHAGEWTTCADISLAVRRDTSVAWMVCWAAARLPEFPAPHRVLLDGGRPHPYGHEHGRPRPGVVCPALLGEGLRFDGFGRADRSRRVAWDELTSRMTRTGQLEVTPDARRLGGDLGQRSELR
jgi:hypothetical protein